MTTEYCTIGTLKNCHLDFLYSYNTDGYLASWTMYVPFLSRSVNQWAYTLAGLKNESYYYVYGSGDLPAGTVLSPTDLPLDSLQQYNGDETVELMKVKGFISDSLSFRVSRSFGGTQICPVTLNRLPPGAMPSNKAHKHTANTTSDVRNA